MKPFRASPQERLRSLSGSPSGPLKILSGHPAKPLQSISSQELISEHLNNMSEGHQSLSGASHEALVGVRHAPSAALHPLLGKTLPKLIKTTSSVLDMPHPLRGTLC